MRAEKEAANEAKFLKTLANAKRPTRVQRSKITTTEVLTKSMWHYNRYWIRKPEDWKYTAKSVRPKKLHDSLLQHLFCEFPVPDFLLEAWDSQFSLQNNLLAANDNDFRMWFIWITQGKSLAKELNKKEKLLTKREIHMFADAPQHLSPIQAVWWAKAMCFSNSQGIASCVAQSPLGQSQDFSAEANGIFHQLMMFFCSNFIAEDGMTEIYDYVIRFCVEEARREGKEYSLKGRTLASIRRGVTEWHHFLHEQSNLCSMKWAPSGLQSKFVCHFGDDMNRVTYNFTEITTGKHLAEEGRKMHHCVSSYADDCLKGYSSIWSLTKQGLIEPKRCLTIEVVENTIVQVSGYANRPARKQERAAVKFWSKNLGLKIDAFAF